MKPIIVVGSSNTDWVAQVNRLPGEGETVGAGDCFVGVFAASLERGLALEEALRHAVSGASLSVGLPGAQASYTYWDNICEVARNA